MIKRTFVWLLSVVGVVCFGLIFIAVFGNSTEIECTLGEVERYRCQTRTLLLGEVPIFERVVEDVVDIKVQVDDCFEGCSYRAEFVTANGEQVPLSSIWTEEADAAEPVHLIGLEFGRRAATIEYTIEPFWWVLWLIGGVSAVVLLVVTVVVLRR